MMNCLPLLPSLSKTGEGGGRGEGGELAKQEGAEGESQKDGDIRGQWEHMEGGCLQGWEAWNSLVSML